MASRFSFSPQVILCAPLQKASSKNFLKSDKIFRYDHIRKSESFFPSLQKCPGT
jgi:hypothetical protein